MTCKELVYFLKPMDAKYYPKDVKWAKKQEFLRFKHRKTMSVMEYVAKFSELSCFAPVCVATDEMRIERFEHGLKGKRKEAVVGTSMPTSKRCTKIY